MLCLHKQKVLTALHYRRKIAPEQVKFLIGLIRRAYWLDTKNDPHLMILLR